MIFITTGELDREKIRKKLKLAREQDEVVQVERLEALLTNGGEQSSIPHGFYQMSQPEKSELEAYIGMRPVYVSVVDHNSRHLQNAFERDDEIKAEILKVVNSDSEGPLAVLYERDGYSFMGECLAHEYDSGAHFIRGEFYNAFIQEVVYEVKTDEETVFKPATLVRLFRLPEKKRSPRK